MSNQRPLPPAPIRWASIIAILQSLVALGYGGFLAYRNVIGVEDPTVVTEGESNMEWVGIGTAVYLLIIFGTVIAAAISMLTGRRWGRGPVVFLQIILLPISFYMVQGGAYLFAAVTGISALLGLVMLFNSQATQWAAARHGS